MHSLQRGEQGTLWHRHWACKAIASEREQGVAKAITDEATDALEEHAGHPLWSRGLLCMDQLPTLPPIALETMHFYRNSAHGTLTGMVFTDGSLKQRWRWKASERADWSAISLDGRALSVGAYGPFPGPIQSVPRAELFAVAQALRMAVLPLRLYTDHYNINTWAAKGQGNHMCCPAAQCGSLAVTLALFRGFGRLAEQLIYTMVSWA